MSPVRKPVSDGPLKPQVFLLLLALREGPLHGYAAKKAIRDLSGGEVDLDPGSLYRLIARLLDDGLLEETEASEPSDGPERRRIYQLSTHGRMTFEHELARMSRLVRLAGARR